MHVIELSRDALAALARIDQLDRDHLGHVLHVSRHRARQAFPVGSKVGAGGVLPEGPVGGQHRESGASFRAHANVMI
jgi:hypothetical protein